MKYGIYNNIETIDKYLKIGNELKRKMSLIEIHKFTPEILNKVLTYKAEHGLDSSNN